MSRSSSINKLRRFVKRQAPESSSVSWYFPFDHSTAETTTNPETNRSENLFCDNLYLTSVGSNSLSHNDYYQRTARFSAIYTAIRNMSLLPVGHEMHVDALAAEKAENRLAVIAHSYNIPPPKIMAEDDGSVVLTWDYGQFKRYLTIDQEGSDLMDLHKKSSIRCFREIDDASDDLTDILGIAPMATSSVELDV